MVRTQIQLAEGQAAEVKELAAREGVSMAEAIRRAIEEYVARRIAAPRVTRVARIMAVAGKFSSGLRDVARNHDKYLAEAYKE